MRPRFNLMSQVRTDKSGFYSIHSLQENTFYSKWLDYDEKFVISLCQICIWFMKVVFLSCRIIISDREDTIGLRKWSGPGWNNRRPKPKTCWTTNLTFLLQVQLGESGKTRMGSFKLGIGLENVFPSVLFWHSGLLGYSYPWKIKERKTLTIDIMTSSRRLRRTHFWDLGMKKKSSQVSSKLCFLNKYSMCSEITKIVWKSVRR